MNTKFLSVTIFCIICIVKADYMKDRAAIIESEKEDEIGAHLKLSPKEQEVNEILMEYKTIEMNEGFNDSRNFLPAKHFFNTKQKIEQSKVFKIIQRIPKGGSLHTHDSAFVSGEYMYSITHKENLHACVKDDGLKLHFKPNLDDDPDCTWKLVSELREQDPNFDDFLKSKISLVTENPGKAYPTGDDAWDHFDGAFAATGKMLYYEPVFREYFYQALKELVEDNVMYTEFRSPMHALYNESGHKHEKQYNMKVYLEIIEKVKKDFPKFHGAKMIYAVKRKIDNPELKDYLKTALEITSKYPDFVVGFDLVGHEEKGKPLIDFIQQLLKVKGKTKFFFHAGETNWNGMTTDINLVDAVLLNSTRIGHGYDLLKHHEVLNIVKEQGIAIEVSPISNQVLKLVEDMRNHPAAVWMNRGFNVVICNDDPSFFGTKGLSYDWYMAFMGMASLQSDLRFLKQLALNSLLYSAMGDDEKEKALKAWKQSWDEFLDEILQENSR